MQTRRVYQFNTSQPLALPHSALRHFKRLQSSLKSAVKLTFFVPVLAFIQKNSDSNTTNTQVSQVHFSSGSRQNVHLVVNGRPVNIPKNGTKHETISVDSTTTTVDIHASSQSSKNNLSDESVELHINTHQNGGSPYIET